MGSVLDEFQTHRPLIACTVIGLILGDLKTGIMLRWYAGIDSSRLDERRRGAISGFCTRQHNLRHSGYRWSAKHRHRNRHPALPVAAAEWPGADGVCHYHHHRSVPARGG